MTDGGKKEVMDEVGVRVGDVGVADNMYSSNMGESKDVARQGSEATSAPFLVSEVCGLHSRSEVHCLVLSSRESRDKGRRTGGGGEARDGKGHWGTGAIVVTEGRDFPGAESGGLTEEGDNERW
ncbi:unnamed protein product [Merluccius merluccius]